MRLQALVRPIHVFLGKRNTASWEKGTLLLGKKEHFVLGKGNASSREKGALL